MPDHTSFVSYLIALFPGLEHNTHALGKMALSGEPVSEHHLEPAVTALLVALAVLAMAAAVRPKLLAFKESVVPDDKLTLRTFLEVFVGYFYGLARDVMGPKRAKRFFPVIGTCALFIFFSNLLGIIPGMLPPTSNLNITAGCAILVFLLFNYYGIRENGAGYFKHLFGPWLGPAGIPVNLLIFVVELLSLCIRPVTLAARLMINMAVDHLVVGTFLALIALFVPIPAMILGVIVIVVQTLVFCLLTSVYIGLATEHEEH
jgi:F-type H+-transporting ATPase subunit a